MDERGGRPAASLRRANWNTANAAKACWEAAFLMSLQGEEQQEVTFQVVRDKEIFFDVLVAVLTQPTRKLRVREQETELVRAALHRVHQHPGELVDHLSRDAADGRGHHRFFLP